MDDPAALEETELLRPGLRRAAARLIASVLIALVVVLTTVAIGKPMSGVFWGFLLVVSGFSIANWLPEPSAKMLLRASVASAIVGLLLVLSASGDDEVAFLQQIRIPDGEKLSRWTSLIPERDAALLAVPWVTTAAERKRLATALDATYSQLEADVALRRTTQVRTLFGLQSPAQSDAHVHREGDSTKWVLFLHGFGGNTASGCWVAAQAAARSGWNTLCPSTSVEGRWGRGIGPSVVGSALRYLEGHGATQVVLAGHSNGAVGALELLQRTHQARFAALMLVFWLFPSG